MTLYRFESGPSEEKTIIRYPVISPLVYAAHSLAELVSSRDQAIQEAQETYHETFDQLSLLQRMFVVAIESPTRICELLRRRNQGIDPAKFRFYPYKVSADVLIPKVHHLPGEDNSPPGQITLKDPPSLSGSRLNVRLQEDIMRSRLVIELKKRGILGLPKIRPEVSVIPAYEGVPANDLKETAWSSAVLIGCEYNLLGSDIFTLSKVFNKAITSPARQVFPAAERSLAREIAH